MINRRENIDTTAAATFVLWRRNDRHLRATGQMSKYNALNLPHLQLLAEVLELLIKFDLRRSATQAELKVLRAEIERRKTLS